MPIIPFTPTNSNPPFQFQAAFDGATYIVETRWNITGQRWYVYIFDQSNSLIVTQPLVGSPPPPQNGINLVGGYFTNLALYYYPPLSVFTIIPPIPFNSNPVPVITYKLPEKPSPALAITNDAGIAITDDFGNSITT